MSYADMVLIKQSESLYDRLVMCATQEIDADVPAEWWVDVHLNKLATQPGWGAAFASARANNITDPGADETVITDAQILTAVQTLIAADKTTAAAKAKADKAAEAAKAAAAQKAEQDRRQAEADHEIALFQRRLEVQKAAETGATGGGDLTGDDSDAGATAKETQ